MQWVDISDETPTMGEHVIVRTNADKESEAVWDGQRFQIEFAHGGAIRVFIIATKWRRP